MRSKGAGSFSSVLLRKAGAGVLLAGLAPLQILPATKALCRWRVASHQTGGNRCPSGTIQAAGSSPPEACWQPLMRLAAATAGALALPGAFSWILETRPQLSQAVRVSIAGPPTNGRTWWGCSSISFRVMVLAIRPGAAALMALSLLFWWRGPPSGADA